MMDTQIIFFLVSVFIAVAAITSGIVWWLLTDRIRRRVADVQGPVKSSGFDIENQWMEHVVRISRPLAKLSFPSENWVNSPIRHRLTHAGWRGRAAPTLFFWIKNFAGDSFSDDFIFLQRRAVIFRKCADGISADDYFFGHWLSYPQWRSSL